MDELTEHLKSRDPSDETPGNNSLFIEYGELKKKIGLKMDEWEKLHSELEGLKKSLHHI